MAFKDTESNRQIIEDITRSAIKEVSQEFMVRRELDCDVQYGVNYSQIH